MPRNTARNYLSLIFDGKIVLSHFSLIYITFSQAFLAFNPKDEPFILFF